MCSKKKIIMDLSLYDTSLINDSVVYFRQFNYPFYIDINFCVYVKYDRKYHWIGYSRPLDKDWFFSQFK